MTPERKGMPASSSSELRCRDSPLAFGDWETAESYPISDYFSILAKTRTGSKPDNPNDSQGRFVPSLSRSSKEGQQAQRKPEERGNVAPATRRNSGQFMNSPSGNMYVKRQGSDGYRADVYAKPSRMSEDFMFPHSPGNLNVRHRGTGHGFPSPLVNGRGTSPSTHGTPGRTRRPGKASEPVRQQVLKPSVPAFGDWNDGNYDGDEQITMVFEKAGKKQATSGRASVNYAKPTGDSELRRTSSKRSQVGCFARLLQIFSR